jgi:hypothetical protein
MFRVSRFRPAFGDDLDRPPFVFVQQAVDGTGGARTWTRSHMPS